MTNVVDGFILLSLKNSPKASCPSSRRYARGKICGTRQVLYCNREWWWRWGAGEREQRKPFAVAVYVVQSRESDIARPGQVSQPHGCAHPYAHPRDADSYTDS